MVKYYIWNFTLELKICYYLKIFTQKNTNNNRHAHDLACSFSQNGQSYQLWTVYCTLNHVYCTISNPSVGLCCHKKLNIIPTHGHAMCFLSVLLDRCHSYKVVITLLTRNHYWQLGYSNNQLKTLECMQDLTFNVYASHVLWLEVITNLVPSCKVASKDQHTSAKNGEE